MDEAQPIEGAEFVSFPRTGKPGIMDLYRAAQKITGHVKDYMQNGMPVRGFYIVTDVVKFKGDNGTH